MTHGVSETTEDLWNAYVRAAQARREAQNEILHAVASQWLSGGPRSDRPSWLTALAERVNRLSTEESVAHDEWLRRYCREAREQLSA